MYILFKQSPHMDENIPAIAVKSIFRHLSKTKQIYVAEEKNNTHLFVFLFVWTNG